MDRIRVDLSSAQSANDFEIDWVAIGRPSPGASSAQLAEEATARATADAAEIAAREALSTKLTGQADPSSLTLSTLSSGLLFEERQARAAQDSALSSSDHQPSGHGDEQLQHAELGHHQRIDGAIHGHCSGNSRAPVAGHKDHRRGRPVIGHLDDPDERVDI